MMGQKGGDNGGGGGDDDDKGLSTGAIVGIAVGCGVVVAAIIGKNIHSYYKDS